LIWSPGALLRPHVALFRQFPVLSGATGQKKTGAAAKNRKTNTPSQENPTPATNRAADFLQPRAYARIWAITPRSPTCTKRLREYIGLAMFSL